MADYFGFFIFSPQFSANANHCTFMKCELVVSMSRFATLDFCKVPFWIGCLSQRMGEYVTYRCTFVYFFKGISPIRVRVRVRVRALGLVLEY